MATEALVLAKAAVRVGQNDLIRRAKAEEATVADGRLLSSALAQALAARKPCSSTAECANDLQELAAFALASRLLNQARDEHYVKQWFENHATCPKCCLYAYTPCNSEYAAYNDSDDERMRSLEAVSAPQARDDSLSQHLTADGTAAQAFLGAAHNPERRVAVLVGDAATYPLARYPGQLSPDGGSIDPGVARLGDAALASLPPEDRRLLESMAAEPTVGGKATGALLNRLMDHGARIESTHTYTAENLNRARRTNNAAYYSSALGRASARLDDAQSRISGAWSGKESGSSAQGQEHPVSLSKDSEGEGEGEALASALLGPDPRSADVDERALGRLMDAAAAWDAVSLPAGRPVPAWSRSVFFVRQSSLPAFSPEHGEAEEEEAGAAGSAAGDQVEAGEEGGAAAEEEEEWVNPMRESLHSDKHVPLVQLLEPGWRDKDPYARAMRASMAKEAAAVALRAASRATAAMDR